VEILEAYETQEAIPKEVAENYEQREDGTYVLKFVKGLKGALEKERANVKDREVRLAKLREDGSGEVTAAVAKREAELQEEFKTREESIRKEAMVSAHSAKKKAIVAMALQKAGGTIALLEEKVTAKLAIGEDGEAYVASDDGTPLLDEAGNAMSVDGLIASFRADPLFAAAFKGNGQSGGGTPPGDSSGMPVMSTSAPDRRSQMTPRQKIDYINEHGNDKFLSLPF
jgi:hypothetical protein